jgi:hypothetical protein
MEQSRIEKANGTRERARFHVAEELGGIELLEAQYHRQNFSRHSHEGYTIGVIERGAQRFFRTGGNHVAREHALSDIRALGQYPCQ